MGAGKRGGRRAVFLDRDGVINRNVLNPSTGEHEAPLTKDDFEFVPGALDSLRRLQDAQLLLFLVSNQPNYAKGKACLETLRSIHKKFESGLMHRGIEFAEFYYCFHHPWGKVAGYSVHCLCRKPSPYFLFKAQKDYGVSLSRCWMIGDRPTDVQCGNAARANTILIHSDGVSTGEVVNPDSVRPDALAPDLATAVRLILAAE
jgi:D-glycero-D-manno-heptose 1,7-bisphosphate phosphatase